MSSFFDKVRGRAKKAVDQHGDKITKGLDKAALEADKRTKGKYSDKIAQGRTKAQQAMDKLDGDDRGPGQPGQQPRP